jgi:hypothetical protein
MILFLFMCNGDKNKPVCKTFEDIRKSYGKKCSVIGTYEIKPFNNKKGKLIANWPVVVLEDNKMVLLESFWQKEKMRPEEEQKLFSGKKVRATGKINQFPPGSIENIAIPCISPVDDVSIEP